MKNEVKYSITVNNKRYDYSIKPVEDGVIFLECEAANIAQEFLNEDIPALLLDLPNLIIGDEE